MAIDSGTRFGTYEIGDPIGAGGMGEVYRATDTTLERDVAIKVLPESFASDANRVARFEQEAKTLAALNHPNIAQIFGLEKSDDTTALVMELVEGPTLADRIAEGPLPADEALGIAMQIAEALEAAHGQHIVHRDLKPANIKIRPDGTVKVLDFGIAKALDVRQTSGPESPPLTTPTMTQAGIILGTAQYMSPEQARGKAVDQRADIWSFGCLLYEMLTGQPAFGGEDVTITLARVLERDADMGALPVTVSPQITRTIELCLRKDARKRVSDVRDVRLALEGDFDTASLYPTDEAAITRPMWQRALPVVGAVLVTGLIVAFADDVLWREPEPAPPAVNRFDYELPVEHTLGSMNQEVLALSPDGRQFVYSTPQGLYLRTMRELEARLIAGTEDGANSPIFSPDGLALAYWSIGEGSLMRMAISGGVPVSIAEALTSPYGMSWLADGNILLGSVDGVWRVSASGGTPELIIPIETGAWDPQLLPDGDSVLFANFSGSQGRGPVFVQSISTGERTLVLESARQARYVPTGHVIYQLGNDLFAVAFDLDTQAVFGGSVPLVQDVVANGGGLGPAQFDVASDGTLVYMRGSFGGGLRTLTWVDREGREDPIPALPHSYQNPRLSPDQSKLSIDVREADIDIWTWDFTRETLTRLTFDPGWDRWSSWSPDSRRIAFSSSRDSGEPNVLSVYWKPADGAGAAERVAENTQGQLFPASFAPDGSAILVGGSIARGTTEDDIAALALDGAGEWIPLLDSDFAERNPEISPDGRWIAYSSDVSGQDEIYVRPYPEIGTGRWQISTDGGEQPLWARTGQELFYRNGDAIIAVPIEAGESFVAGNSEILFEGDYFYSGGRTFDVSADGERFLMIKNAQDSDLSRDIVIVQNWFEELKRLVPTE